MDFQDSARDQTKGSEGSRFLYIALAVSCLVLGCSVIPILAIWQSGGSHKEQGWDAEQSGNAWIITQVDESGPAAGILKPGDKLAAIFGDSRAATIGPQLYLTKARAGTEYEITVDRGGELRTEKLQLISRTDRDALYLSIGELVEAFGFLFIGVLIAVVKPGERIARLAFLNTVLVAMYVFALASNSEGGTVYPPLFGFAVMLYVVAPFQWVGGYLFYSSFPFEVKRSGFWRILDWSLISGSVLLWIPMTLSRLILVMPEETARSVAYRYPRAVEFLGEPVHAAYSIFILFSIASILLTVSWNYRSLSEGDLRRRIRWVAWGAVVGLLPMFTINIVKSLLSASETSRQLETGIFVANRICDLLAIMIPVTIAYAIIKHRVLGVRVALRIGLQYMLAKNVLRAVLALPVVGLVLTVIANPNSTVTDLLFSGPAKPNLLLLVLVMLCLRYRPVMTDIIDRRFFLESYRQEQILIDLAESIQKLETIPAISRLLGQQIDQALHPQALYIFYRFEAEQDFSVLRTSPGLGSEFRLPGEGTLVSLLEERRSSITEHEWERRIEPSERTWLEKLQVRVVVPIIGTDHRLLGMLLLGEKKSEEPYLHKDLLLLETVSTQIGVVCENLTLRERVSRERQLQTYMRARLEDRQISIVKECPKCGTCYDSDVSVCAVDGTELTTNLPVERVIQGKYRLEKFIGRGGMGTVYLASDLRLGRKVAIKVMAASLFHNRTARRRFAREAHACARLDHPNIVRIHDFGDLDGGGAFLVLEYIPGMSLRMELPTVRGRPTKIANILSQVLDGVERAHFNGLIHRDLKPENILLRPTPNRLIVKVVDFGLAQIREIEPDGSAQQSTQESWGGTIGYMAPEQCFGYETDGRADIYSLGVITLELLCGVAPYQKASHSRLMTGLQDFVSSLPTSLGRQLDAVLSRCLALDPAHRYKRIADFRADLIPLLATWPHTEPELPGGHDPSMQTISLTLPEKIQSAGKVP